MGMEDNTSGNVSAEPVKQEETTVVVTEVSIKTVHKGWIVEVEYDYNDLDQFAFTELDLMLGFVRDMTGTPIRVI